MATLPQNGTTTGHKNSLTRHIQLITALETTANSLFGNGVVSGGDISHVSGYTVQIATASVLSGEGYLHTLSATQNYTAAEASTTVYVWGVITRTAADYTSGVAVDTYALTLSHNLTGARPSAAHFPLAILTTDGSGVTAIDNAPAGKYQRLLAGTGGVRDTVGLHETCLVPGRHQLIIHQALTVRGTLTVRGQAVVRVL